MSKKTYGNSSAPGIKISTNSYGGSIVDRHPRSVYTINVNGHEIDYYEEDVPRYECSQCDTDVRIPRVVVDSSPAVEAVYRRYAVGLIAASNCVPTRETAHDTTKGIDLTKPSGGITDPQPPHNVHLSPNSYITVETSDGDLVTMSERQLQEKLGDGLEMKNGRLHGLK